MFTEKVNHGVNALWYNAMKDYKPYSDRLRSTNAKEFVRDTILDRNPNTFVKNELLDSSKLNFVPNKDFGS